MARLFEYYLRLKSNIRQKTKSNIQNNCAKCMAKCTKVLIKSVFYSIPKTMDKLRKYDKI